MPRMESLMGSSLGAARFPRARSPTRLLVEEDDHRPDLVGGEEALPRRHGRVPGRSLARQAGPALRDAPEDVALGELRDRARVVEGERRRAEAVAEVSRAVEQVAVAGEAVLVVDPLSHLVMRGGIAGR